METTEENQTEQTVTTPQTQTAPQVQPQGNVDNGLLNTRNKVSNLDYINQASKVGQEGAGKLNEVKVPKWTPISYRMLQNDPELKGRKGALVANALFKGLEGLLSTKASGRDFDPTTAMSQYNQAERDRYIGNVTDKENAMYEAQKQPIENAVSAAAQGAIETEDAALNAYIQNYTAEKDQNRKMDILKQVMGQAGLYKENADGTIQTDENGNPVLKEWTELETADLLSLNQLMQYLSGDTSVMNVLVGQYGPEVFEKVYDVINWLKGLGNGNKGTPPAPTTNTSGINITPKYSVQEVMDGLNSDDPDTKIEMIKYQNERMVQLPDGEWVDVSDLSAVNQEKIAKSLADALLRGERNIVTGIYNSIQKKLNAIDNKGYANDGKKYVKSLQQIVDNFYQNGLTPPEEVPPVSEFAPAANTEIETLIEQLRKDAGKTGANAGTKVDVAALKDKIDNSTIADEVKQNYLDAVAEAEENIKYNVEKNETEKREAQQKKNIASEVAKYNKQLKGLKNDDIKGYDYSNPKKGSYQEALKEANALQSTLKSLNTSFAVIKELDMYKRLLNIAKLAQKGGRFENEDKSGALAGYLSRLGDAKFWEE